jgi:hypothetical protein
MTRDDIHTCSYSCERPACIKAQRDELAQRLFELVAEAVAAEREACAKLAEPSEEHRRDASWGYAGGEGGVELLDSVAAAIRARSEA